MITDEWRTKWRENLPLGLYSTLMIGGCLFIVTAKTLGWSAFIVTVVPILLMLSYFVGCLGILKGLRLHNEQAGDNLYYMGFLFTLTSLGTSLYRFSAGASIDDIVQNFGVAVSSTIAGVALRIFFNQMRRDPLDVDRQLRHELTEMTRRVKTELNSSAREFSSYRRISSQMLTEGFAEIAKQAERNGEAILQSLESMSKDAIRPIQEAATHLAAIAEANNKLVEDRAKANAEMTEAALSKLDTTANRLAELVTAFGNQVETAGNRLVGMRLPEEVLKVEIQPVLAAVTELGQLQAKRLDEAANENAAQAERLKEALAPLLAMPERLESSFRPLNDLSGRLEQSFRPLNELAGTLDKAFQPLNDLPVRLDGSLKAVDGLGQKIEGALKPLAKTAAKIDQSVGSLEKVIDRVEETVKTLPIYGATVLRPVSDPQPWGQPSVIDTVAPKGDETIDLGLALPELPVAAPQAPYSNGEPRTSVPSVAVADDDAIQSPENEPKRWWKWQ